MGEGEGQMGRSCNFQTSPYPRTHVPRSSTPRSAPIQARCEDLGRTDLAIAPGQRLLLGKRPFAAHLNELTQNGGVLRALLLSDFHEEHLFVVVADGEAVALVLRKH